MIYYITIVIMIVTILKHIDYYYDRRQISTVNKKPPITGIIVQET